MQALLSHDKHNDDSMLSHDHRLMFNPLLAADGYVNARITLNSIYWGTQIICHYLLLRWKWISPAMDC